MSSTCRYPPEEMLEFYATISTPWNERNVLSVAKERSVRKLVQADAQGLFVAVKGSRFITTSTLKDCREPSLFSWTTLPAERKTGPLLWQLPPVSLSRRSPGEFCVLLSTLPRSMNLRHTFEFRDTSCSAGGAACPRGIQFRLLHRPWPGHPFVEAVTSILSTCVYTEDGFSMARTTRSGAEGME